MNGSEFQQVYNYIAVLEKRIKVLEKQMESIPRILELTDEQENKLAEIAWERVDDD